MQQSRNASIHGIEGPIEFDLAAQRAGQHLKIVGICILRMVSGEIYKAHLNSRCQSTIY